MINFSNDKSFSVLNKTLDATALKEKVISNNISNINTPNYKRQYVQFDEELKNAILNENKMGLETTSIRHLAMPRELNSIRPDIKADNSRSMREDGNNVDLDMEMAGLSENSIRYNTVVESMVKKYRMLQSVIKGG